MTGERMFNTDGLDRGEVYTHPSYGMITIHRTQGRRNKMFGSDVPHGHFVTVRIYEGEMRRDLSNTWYSQGPLITEFSMTETQWGAFVSSFGQGGGTPITLDHYRSGRELVKAGDPPDLGEETDQLRGEFKETCDGIQRRLYKAIHKLETMAEGKSLKKGDLQDALQEVKMARQDIGSNLPFVASQFDERTEEVITKTKAEMEAHWAFLLKTFGEKQARIVLEQAIQNDPLEIED